MKRSLFWIALFCSLLLGIFLWSPLSLNGYKTDIYFFIACFILCLASFLLYRKDPVQRIKSYISLCLLLVQFIGFLVFIRVDRFQVDKVYTPANNKSNLYASLSLWYKRTYFKYYSGELCGDGELWETKVPVLFPLIEIETSREHCHKVGSDSTYQWLFHHVRE